jgi:hypothetical protein
MTRFFDKLSISSEIEVCKFGNGENTRLRRTDRKP